MWAQAWQLCNYMDCEVATGAGMIELRGAGSYAIAVE